MKDFAEITHFDWSIPLEYHVCNLSTISPSVWCETWNRLKYENK